MVTASAMAQSKGVGEREREDVFSLNGEEALDSGAANVGSSAVTLLSIPTALIWPH